MSTPRTPLSAAQESVGKERFARFVEGQGKIDAEQMFLTLSLTNCGLAGYSDEALAALRIDCDDLVAAAQNLSDMVNALATTWKGQRDRAADDEAAGDA